MNNISYGRKNIILGMFLCLTIGMFVSLGVEHSRILKILDISIMDCFFRLKSPLPVNKNVLLICIDDKTIDALGYPINRGFYALLLEGLSKFGARIIGFDIIFSQQGISSFQGALPDADAFLIESCKKADVYHPIGFYLKQTSHGLPSKETEDLLKGYSYSLKGNNSLIEGKSIPLYPFLQLLKTAKGMGHINLIPDIDGTVRRVPLLIKNNNNCYPCLGLALAGAYLGIQPKEISLNTKKMLMGDISIPVNEKYEMLIQDVGEKTASYSLIDVLQAIKDIKNHKKHMLSSSLFKDKIVLIGITASGSGEFCKTPFSKIESMLNIHSNIVNTILSKKFIKGSSVWVSLLMVLCCGLIAGLCCFLFANPVSRIFLAVGLVIAYSLIAFLSLKYMNLQLYIVAPVLTIFLSSITIIIYQYLWEKREMIRALTRITEFNENILNSINNGLIVVDSAQQVKKINPVALNILGLKKDDQVLLPVEIAELVSNTVKTGKMVKRKNILLGDKNLEVGISFLRNNSSKEQGFVLLINDITRIQELEEQARLNERLADIGILVSNIGHEIGNSLTTIILSADNLKELLPDKDPQKEVVEMILNEANMLGRKTSALKEYAKPITLDLQKTDINQLIEEVLKNISRELESNNIKVKKNLNPDLPLIMLDADHMKGVFLNLIINAIHAMSEGGLLSVETNLIVLEENKKVEIRIQDTGCGIPEHIQNKIFNPFFTTKKQKGTGLGLSIAHKIVTSHGGTLHFETKQGEGTTFIVRLVVEEE